LNTANRLQAEIRMIAVPAPADAALIPVTGFPIPEAERVRMLWLLTTLSAGLAAPKKLSADLFLHIAPTKNAAAAEMLSPNAREWMPQPGLGVWPTRKPPAMLIREDYEHLEPGQFSGPHFLDRKTTFS
jgi:hypothetical protein